MPCKPLSLNSKPCVTLSYFQFTDHGYFNKNPVKDSVQFLVHPKKKTAIRQSSLSLKIGKLSVNSTDQYSQFEIPLMIGN